MSDASNQQCFVSIGDIIVYYASEKNYLCCLQQLKIAIWCQKH